LCNYRKTIRTFPTWRYTNSAGIKKLKKGLNLFLMTEKGDSEGSGSLLIKNMGFLKEEQFIRRK